MVVGETKGPPKCLAEVHHQLLAPQWHIQGEVRSQLDYGLGMLHVSPPWVERHVHDQIGVFGSQWVWGHEVVDILIVSVCNIGWCVVGRQARE